MLFLVFSLFLYCIFLNFGFFCVNEEFIFSLVLIFFFLSFLFFFKNIILAYFLHQKEKIYFFYTFLINLNINLFDKLVYYLGLFNAVQY